MALRRMPFVNAMYYVPTRAVADLPSLTKKLTIRLEVKEADQEGEYAEETVLAPESLELKLYDLSKNGWIGMPRDFGLRMFGGDGYINLSVYKRPQPEFFKGISFKPRDPEQAEFWQQLAALVRGPKPVDAVALARTGTGKTVSALQTFATTIQAPTLVVVPTTYLARQWRERAIQYFGQDWVNAFLGHIQQDRMDYQGRLLTIGIAASLARRNYPNALNRYFTALFFDEWHKYGAPTTSRILEKYPASVRIGFTATERRDALLRVCNLHLGRPRARSRQRVMKPHVYLIDYEQRLERGAYFNPSNPHYWTTMLARSKPRNALLARIAYERGIARDRQVLLLSDRTDQLLYLLELLHQRWDVPRSAMGMIVGSYNSGRWRTITKGARQGERVKERITMSKDEQQRVADTCQIVGATYGLFDTGADVSRLDMGIECTPRGNVEQAVGRVLRIDPTGKKPIPEWYSIRDRIWYYPQQDKENAMGLFSPVQVYGEDAAQNEPSLVQELLDKTAGRMTSYVNQDGTISEFSFD